MVLEEDAPTSRTSSIGVSGETSTIVSIEAVVVDPVVDVAVTVSL